MPRASCLHSTPIIGGPGRRTTLNSLPGLSHPILAQREALPLKDIVRAAENLLGFPSATTYTLITNSEYLEKYDDADVRMGRFSREHSPSLDQGLFST